MSDKVLTAPDQPLATVAPLDVLVVAPHPDDAEIGAGGTLLKCKRAGMRVGIVDLTSGEPTPHGSPEIRQRETAAASEILGLDWRHNLGLPNRSLQSDLESRRALAGVLRVTRPRILLVPYWEDAHPDHVAASRLADDARFWAKLSKTDMPGEPYWPPRVYYFFALHLRMHVRPSFVLDISQFMDGKLAAIGCYKSQFIIGRPTEFPTLMDDIRDCFRYWGWSIGRAFGEPFVSREEVGIDSFQAFL